jgi:hypothetical protein
VIETITWHANYTYSTEEQEMTAYGVVHFFPEGTSDQYEASIAAVHPGEGLLPDGQIFHAAGPSSGGWTIMAVHDSKESWEHFRDGTLLPRMHQGIDGGFAAPPEETVIDIYKVIS